MTYHQGRYGIEIRIDSMQNDGSQSWIVISRGLNKYVAEMPEENIDLLDNVQAQHQASSSPMKAILPFGHRHWRTILVASRADSELWLQCLLVIEDRMPNPTSQRPTSRSWRSSRMGKCVLWVQSDEWIDPWIMMETWCIYVPFKVTLVDKKLILHCNITWCHRTTSFKYIYHVGCSHDLHAIIQSGFIAWGKYTRKGRQTVFVAAVDPMHEHKTKEQHYDVMQPRVVPFPPK